MNVNYIFQKVSTMKDVMDQLEMSSALRVKTAFGVNGEGSAKFVNEKALSESETSYFIQVTVQCEGPKATVLTEFQAVPQVAKEDALQVYGNIFIKGFVYGGMLTAVACIRKRSDEEMKQVDAGAKIDIKVGPVDGAADFGTRMDSLKQYAEGRVDIKVDHRGGGAFNAGGLNTWTVDALQTLAMNFPAAVADTPDTIDALLMRYQQLKSYLASDLSSNLSVDDYALDRLAELADDYIKYKTIQNNLADARVAETLPNVAAPSPAGFQNTADGIEKAQAECREEMERILKGIKAIQADPASAIRQGGAKTSPGQFANRLPFDMTDPLKEAQEQIKELEARVADPYQGYAPVPLGKPLRFFQVWSKLYLSNDLTSGNINIRYEGIQYNQVWNVERASDGAFYIMCINTKTYLCLGPKRSELDYRLTTTTDKSKAITVFFEAQAANAWKQDDVKDVYLVRLHGRHLTSAQFTLQADLKEPGYPNNTDGTIIDVTGSDGNVGWALFHLQDPTARA